MGDVTFPSGVAFVGGEWMQDSGYVIDVLDPSTETVLGHVTEASPDVVDAAFSAARQALPGWSSTPPEERARLLDSLAVQIDEHGEALARLASSEIGTPIREARGGQARFPAEVLRLYARITREYAWEYRDESGSTIRREAAGVVLAITPWNFPVHQIIAKVAPALAAGCTIVLKPSEVTPLNALFLAELCRRIGLPAGVFNVVTGTGAVTGEAMLTSGRYDVVSFTGSVKVGRHIGAIAGGSVVRATLELGGKSPAVVAPDADFELAVATTVRNCFVNAGQKCNAPTRLLVPADRREEAVQIALRTAEEFILGDPLDEKTTMGPLSSAGQRERVHGFLDRARSAGARVLEADVVVPTVGYYTRPAIVTDVAQDSEIVQEEVFGPVLVVQGYDTLDDAIRLANDTMFGLSAEIWSGDNNTAAHLAREIVAGQVRVNGVRTPMPPVSPFGGRKQSGLGRELGPYALDEFIELKAILGDPVR